MIRWWKCPAITIVRPSRKASASTAARHKSCFAKQGLAFVRIKLMPDRRMDAVGADQDIARRQRPSVPVWLSRNVAP